MARSPGNLNPDSKAGNARLGTGRGSNAGRSQPIPKGSLPTPKKFAPPSSMSAYRSAAGQKATAIARYGDVKSVTSTNYTLPIGLPIVGGAALIGTTAAKNRMKQAAIKKASVKTRKGQSRGR